MVIFNSNILLFADDTKNHQRNKTFKRHRRFENWFKKYSGLVYLY